MERTSSIRRKAKARQHKGEVMIAGEQLRYDGREGGRCGVHMLNFKGESTIGHVADLEF